MTEDRENHVEVPVSGHPAQMSVFSRTNANIEIAKSIHSLPSEQPRKASTAVRWMSERSNAAGMTARAHLAALRFLEQLEA